MIKINSDILFTIPHKSRIVNLSFLIPSISKILVIDIFSRVLKKERVVLPFTNTRGGFKIQKKVSQTSHVKAERSGRRVKISNRIVFYFPVSFYSIFYQ